MLRLAGSFWPICSLVFCLTLSLSGCTRQIVEVPAGQSDRGRNYYGEVELREFSDSIRSVSRISESAPTHVSGHVEDEYSEPVAGVYSAVPAEARVARANSFLSRGLYLQAIHEYELLSALIPDTRDIEIRIARCWRALGNPSQALVHAVKGLEGDPNSLEAWSLLAEIYLAAGAFDEARLAALEILKLDSNNFKALEFWGEALLALERYPEAVTPFERLVSLESTRADWQEKLAKAAFLSGNEERALGALFGVYDRADALNRIGEFLAEDGRWAEAQVKFEQALALDPELRVARVNLLEADSWVTPESVVYLPPFARYISLGNGQQAELVKLLPEEATAPSLERLPFRLVKGLPPVRVPLRWPQVETGWVSEVVELSELSEFEQAREFARLDSAEIFPTSEREVFRSSSEPSSLWFWWSLVGLFFPLVITLGNRRRPGRPAMTVNLRY